ncbi:MAG: glycosyltransferase [Variovorax sp.]|nr:MAG: glycosyltransferase [Variovorax sp.]
MRLLHLIASVDPRGGGPVEGMLRIHAELQRMGHQGDILCLDAPDAPHVHAVPGRVHALGPVKGTYGYSPALVPWLRQHASSYDAVIVNGLWQYTGLAAWRALRDSAPGYHVFTHGMLDPWFKRRYPLKHLKKWLYWPWGEYRVLRDAKAVLFTCDEERLLARQSFWLYRAREVISSYGAAEPPPDEGGRLAASFLDRWPELRGQRLALFLGRIHEKKGCDLLIEAFARISATHPDTRLVMAGPDADGWSGALQQRASRLGVSDRITWTGMLTGDLKWGAFYASEVFCLPSHQENFGVAVAEALACGKPVLLSDKVNIWREIEQDGAGWVAPDTLDGTISTMTRWLDASPSQLEAVRHAARQCFSQRFRIETVATNLVKIFQTAHPVPSDTRP